MSPEDAPTGAVGSDDPTQAAGTVHREVQSAVMIATLDAWAQRNSLGATGVRAALNAAQEAFEADASLRVMVITGANGVFSAGGNLAQLREISDLAAIEARLAASAPFLERMITSDKLYVAAVEGPAFGAGMGYALACDLVVASTTARFCAAQIRVGASPDGGLLWALPQRVGAARARRLLLTGEEVDQARALDWGLADHAAPAGGARAQAVELALRLAAGPPLAQRTIKRFFASAAQDALAVMREERRTAASNFVTADFREGAGAFLEKRRPVFRGL